MISARTLASVAAIALLAACSGQESKAPEPTPNPPVIEAVEADAALASCGADKLGAYVNTMMSDEALAKIKTLSGAKTVRVVGPRDMMTMDFRQDRLTIATTEDGRIKSVRCV